MKSSEAMILKVKNERHLTKIHSFNVVCTCDLAMPVREIIDPDSFIQIHFLARKFEKT